MRINAIRLTSPDVDASRAAYRHLGAGGVRIEVVEGRTHRLDAVVLGVTDVDATERLLQRRGLEGDAAGFDLGDTTWRLAPETADVSDGEVTLDHVVVRTDDAERAAADFGARLGMDLRLDRTIADRGVRGLFFKAGESVIEVLVPLDGGAGPKEFGGLAWESKDIAATRERLLGDGVEVSEIRPGRKPGTVVATVRDADLATPTLLIATA